MHERSASGHHIQTKRLPDVVIELTSSTGAGPSDAAPKGPSGAAPQDKCLFHKRCPTRLAADPRTASRGNLARLQRPRAAPERLEPPDARFVDPLLPGLHLDLPELWAASGKRAFSGGEHPISAAAGGMHSV